MNPVRILEIPNRLVPLVVLATAVAILVCDYWTGPDVRFTILYVAPVAYAAWLWRFSYALLLALTMPLLRLAFVLTSDEPTPASAAAINMVIQWSTLIGISVLISRMITLQKRVRVLEGILPICSFCKKIRSSDGNWESLEGYITRRSEAHFSHGFCPKCGREHYPEFFKEEPPP